MAYSKNSSFSKSLARIEFSILDPLLVFGAEDPPPFPIVGAPPLSIVLDIDFTLSEFGIRSAV